MSNNLRLQRAQLKLSKCRLPMTVWLLCVSVLPTLVTAILYSPQLGLSSFYGYTGRAFALIEYSALVCASFGCFMLGDTSISRTGLKMLTAGILIASAPFVGTTLAHSVREHAYERVADRSIELQKAIGKYERAHGSPPEILQQLVPEYISSVPSTGLPACPDFSYSKIGYRMRGCWELSLRFTAPQYGDEFVYGPSGEYMGEFDPGTFRKISDWIYVVHD